MLGGLQLNEGYEIVRKEPSMATMNRPAKLIAIRYGNAVLNNEDAVRKLSDTQMELSRRERQNASFNSEWDDFVDDFPSAETYLRTDFVDRVFPTFKECVLAKEYVDESGSDASSDDGESRTIIIIIIPIIIWKKLIDMNIIKIFWIELFNQRKIEGVTCTLLKRMTSYVIVFDEFRKWIFLSICQGDDP